MESIYNLIARQLRTLYPTNKIYMENQDQGFTEHTFFINRIDDLSVPNLFGRQFRTYNFQIVYFPSSDNPNADMFNVEETLKAYFTELTGFAKIREPQFVTVDNTLSFTFKVMFRAFVDTQGTPMKDLNQTQNIKERGE